MPDANWYPDPADPAMIRYFDGSAWTEHTQPTVAAPASPEPASAQEPSKKKEPSLVGELLNIAFIGAFIGIMLGGALLNGLGALSPLSVEPGTLDRLEIDVSLSDNTNPTNRLTYYLSGTTDTGDAWRIADDEAYRIVEEQGYPQRVTVGIADWTGKAAQVTGETWSIDRQSTGNRIAWGIAIGFMVVVGLIGVAITSRTAQHTVSASLAFAVAYFVVGNWLGYQMFSWIQSA